MAEQAVADPHAGDSHAHEHPRGLAHHFEDLGQQREAAELGMWLFLVTEFMFFGALFFAYFLYRTWYPEGFAVASHHMNVTLGTINTVVLLGSSLTMALAVLAAHDGKRKLLIGLLIATIVLGVIFLGIKAVEYYEKYHHHHIPFLGLPFEWDEGHREGAITYLNLYFIMTGLHAFHMVIGLGLMTVLVVAAWRGGLLYERSIVVHNSALYWHFVDLVWVYLFPFFYLVALHN